MRLVATSDPASSDRHWHELALKDDEGNEYPLEAILDLDTGQIKLIPGEPA